MQLTEISPLYSNLSHRVTKKEKKKPHKAKERKKKHIKQKN